MNHKPSIAAVILGLCVLSLPAVARMPGPPPGGHPDNTAFLARFDSDGDGLVTREEIEAARAAEFSSADSDQDGQLSYSEFDALEQQRKAERLSEDFVLLDQDDSGGIGVDEFSNGQPSDRAGSATVLFGLADLDADGSLSLTELRALRESGQAKRHYANLDQDADGSLSETEFTSAPNGPPRR